MDEKRNTPIFLVSLLALQFWSMVFAALTLSNPYVGIPAYQPFGNQTVGDAAANSLSLLLPVLIFTFVLIFVIRMFPNIFRAVVILFPLFGFLVSNVGGFNIGTGDLVFYSMIASAAFILKGLLVSVFVVALIEFGTYLTTYLLLKYKRMLPGLPNPIFLGTGALILLSYFF